MSEIVRPTRDGIHGREYISTAIDLGKTHDHLMFNENGDLVGGSPSILDIPLPILVKVPPFGAVSSDTIKGWSMAARRLGTLLALPQERFHELPDDFSPWLTPLFSAEGFDPSAIPDGVRLVEIPWMEDWQRMVESLKGARPDLLISISVPAAEGMEEKALSLAKTGVIIHVEGSQDARLVDDRTRTLKDAIRSVHLKLVEEHIRDEVTLLASGGISMAEHVAKALICGADAVFIDFPVLIALECRMCKRCTKGLSCPVEIDNATPSWVALRTMNLLGAWHNQLLEVMGAMGMRDARRLRGEAGRAMFFEDLDRSTFGSLGEVEEGCEIE